MRRLTLLIAISLMFQNIIPQLIPAEEDFISPVDFQVFLSGNFAELRTDHFHSGIDIKTQGVNGKSIYSIADGYVSRIKIQEKGYGKAIYINHPNGFTSVYGHLSRYNNPIGEYVKRYQYRNQTHTLDIYPAKNELPVKKGEVIAYSGNTGSSSGPHLHFEIRNAANQHPLNGQKFGIPITDNVDPRIFNFYLYTFEGNGRRRTVKTTKKIGLSLSGKIYHPKSGDTLIVDSPFSFGMEVFDFLNGANNRCGIHFIKMLVNDKLVYHFQADEFSFSESRYINAHIDYSLKEKYNEKVHLLFRKPNNRLSMYPYIKDEGIINLLPGEVKKLKIAFSDISGNARSVDFWIKGDAELNDMTIERPKTNLVFRWDQVNEFQNHLIKLHIPAGSLYEDADFSYLRVPMDNIHPWMHITGKTEIPLHKHASLMLKADGIPASLINKACIVSYNKSGEPNYEGGDLQEDNWLLVKTRKFGRYGIEIDTLAPRIIPVNFRQNSDISGERSVRFIIRDNLSGIRYYKGFIDNKWVLFEYDPKNELLYHNFDPDKTEKGKKHELEIYVEDHKGNKAMYHSVFIW